MKKFNQRKENDRNNGFKKQSFNSKENHSFNGRDFSNRTEMHRAVCSDCGKACEVPFKPTGSKPVLCSDCFSNSKRDTGGRRPERNFSNNNFGEKQMFAAVCSKCGNGCEVPFKPTGSKPVLCSRCFEQKDNNRERKNFNNSTSNTNNDQLEKQIQIINEKLDKILKNLPTPTPVLTPKILIKKETLKPDIKIIKPEIKKEKEKSTNKKVVKNIKEKITDKKKKIVKK
jgi:CxxC-x17-CxxC domain-containing protein